MSEQKIDALMEETGGLSAEFKEKAKPIFESAVAEATKEIRESYEATVRDLTERLVTMEEQHKVELEEQYEAMSSAFQEAVNLAVEEETSTLVARMNEYAQHVVEEFQAQHEAKLVAEMKVKLAESMMGDLKALFAKYNIAEVEGVGAMEEQVASYKAEAEEAFCALAEQHEYVKGLEAKLEAYERDEIIEKCSKNLSESAKERFQSIIEQIECPMESFEMKANIIAESLTTSETAVEEESLAIDSMSIVSDAPVVVAEEVEEEEGEKKVVLAPEVDYFAKLL